MGNQSLLAFFESPPGMLLAAIETRAPRVVGWALDGARRGTSAEETKSPGQHHRAHDNPEPPGARGGESAVTP